MKTLSEGKKLYAVIIAFLLIITFFITFFVIRNHYKYVLKHVIAENTSTVNLLSTLMYEHQKAATSILESYAQRPLFIDAVKKKDFHRAMYHLKSLREHYSEIDALFLTDQYGTLWANYPVSRESYGKNLAYRDWYKGVCKKWRPYISTLYRSVVLGKGLAVAVSVPILDRKGKIIGILSGAQRVAFLTTLIKGNIIDPEKSTTLLDQEGNVIFSNTIPYQENITKYPDAHVLEKALAGAITNMEIADAKEKGSISYVSIAPVRGIGWSVIVGQEKNAIWKQLYGYFILSAVTGSIIFLFLTVCLLYFRREYKYRKTKELRESEERLRTIVEASLDTIIAVNTEGQIVLFNGAAQELFQYSEEEALNQPVDILLREEICKIHQERLEKFLQRGVGQCGHIGRRMEKSFRRKDGSLFEAEVSMSGGRLDGLRLVVLVIHDITERKRAEEALQKSEEKYRNIFNDAILGIYQTTPEGRILNANPALVKMYGYDTSEELINNVTATQMYVNPEDREIFKGILSKEGVVEKFEVPFRKTPTSESGEIIWVSINAHVAKDRQGNITHYEGTIEDITERKRTENALRTSLQEKEILIREVHHRVKNNMQVMSGLLDLQASSTGNPELAEMLNESQRRIQSMALIHEKLYNSKDFTRIDLAGYVRTLSRELFQAYKINPGKIDLIIQTDGAVYVDISKAIPCGLILNELISNALKHAFPGNEPGKLEIIIRETKNTEIEILVRDNGLGIPDDVDIHQPRSMGLHLVNGLVIHQLDGQIEVIRDAGTEFRIKFPLLFVENKGVV